MKTHTYKLDEFDFSYDDKVLTVSEKPLDPVKLLREVLMWSCTGKNMQEFHRLLTKAQKCVNQHGGFKMSVEDFERVSPPEFSTKISPIVSEGRA